VPIRAVLNACIVQIRERTLPGNRTACKPESPWLIGAAAGIPQIIRIRETERIELALDRYLCVGPQNQGCGQVVKIHHVEKRSPRVLPGGGKKLKEGFMPCVVRVLVAGCCRV